jgi:hypothetical protein
VACQRTIDDERAEVVRAVPDTGERAAIGEAIDNSARSAILTWPVAGGHGLTRVCPAGRSPRSGSDLSRSETGATSSLRPRCSDRPARTDENAAASHGSSTGLRTVPVRGLPAFDSCAGLVARLSGRRAAGSDPCS